jgi:hypothetical protein
MRIDTWSVVINLAPNGATRAVTILKRTSHTLSSGVLGNTQRSLGLHPVSNVLLGRSFDQVMPALVVIDMVVNTIEVSTDENPATIGHWRGPWFD